MFRSSNHTLSLLNNPKGIQVTCMPVGKSSGSSSASTSAMDRLPVDLIAAIAQLPQPSTSCMGNIISDLPPFAVALAANAEGEDKKKQRRLGLIEEAELDLE